MASSSSAIPNCANNYDVFLSFRGEDTRYNFTSHLHKALVDHNIKVFIDYNIRRGQEITVAIERVIEDAKLYIIVFSKNYADSTFCLDELLKIMDCRESKSRIVLPIFYKVEPSEDIYQEAFAKHEKETDDQEMKVERWKSAFRKALGLAGEPIDDKSNEAERIEKFTCEVLMSLRELNNSLSRGEERICASLVGQTVENNFEEIWECLMNDKISRVGVFGMGGVGKTTIATRINNQLLEVPNLFTHIFWVTVSKDSSIYNLQSDIAKKIKLDLSKDDDEKRRGAMIRKDLCNKKFVLILDDVWEAYELTEDVGLPPLVSGQKLLVTSRSSRVCERMECQPIEVKPLSKSEGIDLFVKESNFTINNCGERRKIMESIVEECGCLPLAIVVVARGMRGVAEIWKWRDTLRELQKPFEGKSSEIYEKVFKVLKLSYDRLPNDRCRQCFLYFSLFPEDYELKRDDLIDYWIGMGLIDEVDSRQAELDKMNCILDELIHASLLENNYGQFVKMHDVIRDMARMNVNVGLQFEYPLESVQVLNCFSNLAPHCFKLKTLLYHEQLKEFPSCSFTNMQSLNVLHVTGSMIRILHSIANLGNLRLLIISECRYLESISSLVGLNKLRHLKISNIRRLRKIPEGMDRLFNLRVLDLSNNSSLSDSCVVKRLSHLQTLDFSNSGVEVDPEELIGLEKLEVMRVHVSNLHKLNCYVKSEHWLRLLDYQIIYRKPCGISWPPVKKGMFFEAIRDVSAIFLPNDIKYLKLVDCGRPMFYVVKDPTLAHLQEIVICTYKSRYLFTIDLAQQVLHNVEVLDIYNCDGLEEIIGREEELVKQTNHINSTTILLPNLKMLNLYNLPKLRSIYRGRLVCPSLELIQIIQCDKIERLPFCMDKEGNNQNPSIKLRAGLDNIEYPISRRWWDSLQWDDPNEKSIYLPVFDGEGESELFL